MSTAGLHLAHSLLLTDSGHNDAVPLLPWTSSAVHTSMPEATPQLPARINIITDGLDMFLRHLCTMKWTSKTAKLLHSRPCAMTLSIFTVCGSKSQIQSPAADAQGSFKNTQQWLVSYNGAVTAVLCATPVQIIHWHLTVNVTALWKSQQRQSEETEGTKHLCCVKSKIFSIQSDIKLKKLNRKYWRL